VWSTRFQRTGDRGGVRSGGGGPGAVTGGHGGLPLPTGFPEGKEWKGKESGRRGRREGAEAKAATPTAVNFTARQSSPHACAIVWVAVSATVTVTVIHRQSPIIPEMNFSRIRNSNIANFY